MASGDLGTEKREQGTGTTRERENEKMGTRFNLTPA